MSAGKLPEGWVQAVLGDYLYLKNGFAFKSTEYVTPGAHSYPVIRISDLDGTCATDSSAVHVLQGAEGFTIEKGDLLIAMSGATTGKIGIYAGNIPAYQNQRVGNIKLRSSKYGDEKYRNYLITSASKTILDEAYGGAQPNISGKSIEALSFHLAPLAEQKIIAEKLDTLLAQVDSTKARLEQIPQILKRFRQAVLSTAASGCLTNKWRERYTQKEEIDLVVSKYKPTDNLFKQAKQSLPDIPQSWRVVPSAHLIEYVTSGSRGWANYYSTEGALFLRMSNVRYNTTRLDLQDLQFVNLPGHVEGKRSLVKIDDLIISLTADVGRVARIDKDLGEAYINQHLALLRPNNNINSEYFALSIAAQNIGVKQIQSLKRGATKVGLGLDDIRSLAIPLPSLEEQHEIVRRVEQLFAWADTIEKQVNNSLTRVNNLTQSILAKAFRGELTAQWRAENPDLISGENSAAALLEKIKAERATSDGKKTSRKKS
ncbi:restriction endonuclease subunit S [Salmonella enterica subsp. diarizonae serovar 35:k:e,n,x,z15]|nr:type I restriction endonuclease subunit S [Salmonella enterica]EAW1263529.1 type I restriction endonuclease subunit S [Salmonella enterica subsp. diarizonae]EIE2763214.1 restriction endonuclease subunit S [Salmonella enterica subsp. diarizonae serovar 35:k:e,n,x,z15]EBF9339176.1 type I restriction endonuclease subunit S [Salmonella enterica]EBK4296921.1 type I restriction endonuclease subunit S [Salmonella enterica]